MIQIHSFSRILLAGSLVMPLAQFAVAQQPRGGIGQGVPGLRTGNDLSGRSDANAGANGAVAGAVAGGQILRGSEIIGGRINLHGGSQFGTISDFVLGDGGCVDYVVASYQGQYVPIPWAAGMWQPGQRMLMVDIDPGRIHEMPMFRSFSELSNRQFSDKVHTFYRGTLGQNGDMNRGQAPQHQGASNTTSPRPAAGTTATAPSRPSGNATQGTRGREGRGERR